MKDLDSIRRLHKKLGMGARGVVYLGFNDDTGAFVAIKEVSLVEPTHLSDDGAPPPVDEAAQVLRELRVMQQVRHERLVGYLGARRSLAGVEIVLEYVGGGSLERLLRYTGPLRETVARRYVRDIVEGLHYLHDTVRVCHRDIKPGNVLLTPEGRCKLTDFGASAILGGGDSFMQTTVGTPWYMAPEVIRSGGGVDDDDDDAEAPSTRSPRSRSAGYTTGADIWSLGVTLFEMLSGEKPFGGQLKNTAAVMFAILNTATVPPVLPARCAASAELQSFVGLCLAHDHRRRPTARELLQHPWLAEGRPTVTHPAPTDAPCLRAPPPLPPRDAPAAELASGGGTRSTTSTSPLTPSHRSEDSDDAASAYEQVRRHIEAKEAQAQQQQQQQQLNPTRAAAQIMERYTTTAARSSGSGRRGSASAKARKGLWSLDGHYVDLPDDNGDRLPY